jgi:geranylgeranyl diphosphate synthase type II
MDFQSELAARKEKVDQFIAQYWAGRDWPKVIGIDSLKQSIEYSVLAGGKRFRPVLAILIAEGFGAHPKQVLPVAMAIEFIHTYSLIHDDLPCMDNDDFRRGQPTNHKKFGESTALLAGDALLTQAFSVIAEAYVENPMMGLKLVRLIAEASGAMGMVGGQEIDLQAQTQKVDLSLNALKVMHQMKTGALIRVSCEAAAVACGLPEDKVKKLRTFGEFLGLAFQIADDILDAQEKEETGSYPSMLGLEGAQKELELASERGLSLLTELQLTNSLLSQLVLYNKSRSI